MGTDKNIKLHIVTDIKSSKYEGNMKKLIILCLIVLWFGHADAASFHKGLNALFKRDKRCTKVECDATQALSYCSPINKPCAKGHEETGGQCLKGESMRCCRTACGGPGSYCLTQTSPCYSADEHFEQGNCPVPGFRCCRPTEKVKNAPKDQS